MNKTVIIFLSVYATCIICTILVDAAWGVYIYELLYFLNPPARWWGGSLPALRYSFIVALAIATAYVLRHDKYSQNKLFSIPQSKWLIGLTLMMFLVGFIAVWPERHWSIFKNHFKLILFVLLAYKIVDTPQKFERMIWTFLIGNFYIGWVAHNTGRNAFGRLEGVGPVDGNDSNTTASILLTAVPILLSYLLTGKRWQKALSFIFLAYIMNGIILCNSRGAFLALVVSGAFMFYSIILTKVVNIKEKVKMITLGLAGLGLFIYLTDSTFWERMGTLKEVSRSEETGALQGSGAGRTYFWLRAVELANEYPVGVGAWGYQYLSPEFLPDELLTGVGGARMRAAHSIWFETLAEYGYLGLGLFIAYLFATLNLARRISKISVIRENSYLYYQNTAIAASLIGLLAAGTFIDRLYCELIYWLPMFIGCFANIYIYKGYAYHEEVKGAMTTVPLSAELKSRKVE